MPFGVRGTRRVAPGPSAPLRRPCFAHSAATGAASSSGAPSSVATDEASASDESGRPSGAGSSSGRRIVPPSAATSFASP
jgi:hypothetical protein